MKEFLECGKIVSTHGVRGEVKAEVWMDSPEEMTALKTLYLDGGKLIQGFLREGLVNELTITRIPVLLGQGIPLFGELAKDVLLQHMKTTSYESGFVQSTYRVVR